MNARTYQQQTKEKQQQQETKFAEKFAKYQESGESAEAFEQAVQAQIEEAQRFRKELEEKQAGLARRQSQNVRAQRDSVELKLRGSTTSHVGKPKLGPYVRRPRDPVLVTSRGKNTVLGPVTNVGPTIRTPKPRPGLRPKVGAPSKSVRGPPQLGSNSPALPGRTATSTRVGSGLKVTPLTIQERLKKKSQWYQSIMSPISGGGSKIPDPVGTNTGTYQHVETVTVQVNNQGVAGLRIISPYVNSYTPSGNFTGYESSNYQITIPASGTNNLRWGGNNNATPSVPTEGMTFPYARVVDMMKSVAQGHRIVSASVVAQSEVSTLNDAGEMLAMVKPFGCNASGTLYQTYQAQWDTSITPVNQHVAMAAKWYPVSSDYAPFNGTDEVSTLDDMPFVSYQDFVDPNDRSGDLGVIPFEYGVIVTGLTPNVGVIRFQIVTNFEFIPKTSSGMVTTTEEVDDITESTLVNKWVADTPVTGIISQREASRPPAATPVEDEPSGFGMMFNVVEEMLPLIVKGISLL